MAKVRFEWDLKKDQDNQEKHGVSFVKAQFAFADPRRVIAEDLSHSAGEKRHYCFGLGRWRNPDGPVHIPGGCHSNFRGRLLAERQENL